MELKENPVSESASGAEMINEIVAKFHADADFRRRLTDDPVAVLRARGVPIPPGVEIVLVADTVDTMHFPIPAEMSDTLSDENLDQVVGGATMSCAGSLATFSCPASSLSTASTAGSLLG